MRRRIRLSWGISAALALVTGCASVLGLPDEYSAGAGPSDAAVTDAGDIDASTGGTGGTAGAGGAAGTGGAAGAGGAAGTGGAAGAGGAAGTGGAAGDGGADGGPAVGTILGLGAGVSGACAIVQTSTAEVYCWGDCSHRLSTHACPDASGIDDEPKVVVKDAQFNTLGDVKELAAGETTHCALTNGGEVWCWGNCAYGAVGNDTCQSGIAEYALPVQKAGGGTLTGIVHLGGGGATFCAADSDDRLYCWGVDPLPPFASDYVAVPGDIIPGITRIDAGGTNVCVLANGTVRCWGDNANLQSSGVPTDGGNPYGPFEVPIAESVTDIAVGNQHACALGVSQRIVCWGDWRQLQTNQPGTVATQQFGPLEAMTAVSGQYWYSCALSASGKPYCWGKRPELWLGTTDGAQDVEPTVVTRVGGTLALDHMQLLSGKGNFACAASQTEVYCWGDLGYVPGASACSPVKTARCAIEAQLIQGLP